MPKIFTLILFAIFCYTGGSSQVINGVDPPSFSYLSAEENIPVIHLGNIDYDRIRIEDEQNDINGMPFRYGTLLPVNANLLAAAPKYRVPGKGWIWMLGVTADGAEAMGLYFSKFELPEGGLLFVYDQNKTNILGGFSASSTSTASFATALLPGNSLIIEYFQPQGVAIEAEIVISEALYAYRGVGWLTGKRGFGDSGNCEVNMNCQEGNDLQNQKRGVVRISARNKKAAFWCTGVLLNNVIQDYTPYLLTADHCAFFNGSYATPQELNQWVFYFNYESENCEDPVSDPGYDVLTGASMVSHGGNTGKTGSDFYLVILNDNIPGAFNPYFNGWNRVDESGSFGNCIHHPQGDIKKVSTYTTQLTTTGWSGSGLPSHWKVLWSETENGYGVTEGGSSGSPLYDHDGYVIGTLTGGGASCTNLDEPDYFGKFSYHWESNGTSEFSRLKEWLDPGNSGTTKLGGSYYENVVAADFKADTTVVAIDHSIGYKDLSVGDPDSWEWYFEGGHPGYVTGQDPGKILYDSYGAYDVMLVTGNEIMTDTLIKQDYIHVEPVITPNPSDGTFDIYLGNYDQGNLQFEVFGVSGQLVRAGIEKEPYFVRITLPQHENGMYFIRIRDNDTYSTSKVMVID